MNKLSNYNTQIVYLSGSLDTMLANEIIRFLKLSNRTNNSDINIIHGQILIFDRFNIIIKQNKNILLDRVTDIEQNIITGGIHCFCKNKPNVQKLIDKLNLKKINCVSVISETENKKKKHRRELV